MGAPRDYSREGEGDWATPHENPDEMGCPGSWYRSGFVQSLLRYYRKRDDKGGRVANPALDQCTDPLVHEAILVLESWEDEGWADYLDAVRKAGE